MPLDISKVGGIKNTDAEIRDGVWADSTKANGADIADIVPTRSLYPSDTLQHSDDDEVVCDTTTLTKKKEISLPSYLPRGKIKVTFDSFNDGTGAYNSIQWLQKNEGLPSVTYWNIIDSSDQTWNERTYEIEAEGGDVLSLWGRKGYGAWGVNCKFRNFRIYYDEVNVPPPRDYRETKIVISNHVRFSVSPTQYVNAVNKQVAEIILPDYLPEDTYRVNFFLRAGGTRTTSGRVYRNGVAHGTAQSCSAPACYTKTVSEDLVFKGGDKVQLWGYQSVAEESMNEYLKDFEVCFDYVDDKKELGAVESKSIKIHPVAEHAGTSEITDDGTSPPFYADTESGTATTEGAPNVHLLEDIDFHHDGIVTIISMYFELIWQHKTAAGTAYSKIQISGNGGSSWVDVTDSIDEINTEYQAKTRKGVGRFLSSINAGLNQLQIRLVSWEAGGNSSSAQIRSDSHIEIAFRKD